MVSDDSKKSTINRLPSKAGIQGTGAKKTIEVVPYNPEWPHQFEAEKKSIEKALGSACTQIIHIGSTSVPGLSAKPLIDIIVVIPDIKAIEEKLFEIGYKFNGEFNIPFRFIYGKKSP